MHHTAKVFYASSFSKIITFCGISMRAFILLHTLGMPLRHGGKYLICQELEIIMKYIYDNHFLGFSRKWTVT